MPDHRLTYKMLAEGTLLLIDKPIDWTSFDVVNKVRNAIRIKKKVKVGHAGTLDPKATGLLLVATGKFTKKISELQGLDKKYDGVIEFGMTTPSYDTETAADQTFSISLLSPEQITQCAATFVGSQQQYPPKHSAIKINGKRAYQLARKGEDVKIKSREIEIYSFRIKDVDLPEAGFEVHVSKGTYIRSLAYDMGRKLNNGAYLKNLRRTAIGSYDIHDAWQLDDLIEHIRSLRQAFLDEAGI